MLSLLFFFLKSHVWAKTKEETNTESYSLLSSNFFLIISFIYSIFNNVKIMSFKTMHMCVFLFIGIKT